MRMHSDGAWKVVIYRPITHCAYSLDYEEATTSSAAGPLRPPTGRNQLETTSAEDSLHGRTRSVSRSWASIASSS